VDFLEENPEASIVVHPMQYAVKEKEYILLFEAKKKFYIQLNNMSAHSFGGKDSMQVEKMSVKDSSFMYYLDKHKTDKLMFTVQEKAAAIVPNALVEKRFLELRKQRENTFREYFKENDMGKQIKIMKPQNIIPYNGFSYFKIDYKGEIPGKLKEAYEDMEKYNDEEPRKKYKAARGKNKGD
jgi:hypothetical protein